MKFLQYVAALALALALPLSAHAQIGPKHAQSGNMLLLSADCADSEADRTFTINSNAANGYGLGDFQIDFTRSAVSTVTFTCKTSRNRGRVASVTWAQQTTCSSTTSGVCTLVPASWTRDVSGGSENISVRTDFLGASDIQCTLSCNTSSASDTFVIYGKLSTL